MRHFRPPTEIMFGVTTSSPAAQATARAIQMLILIDERTRECLALDMSQSRKREAYCSD